MSNFISKSAIILILLASGVAGLVKVSTANPTNQVSSQTISSQK